VPEQLIPVVEDEPTIAEAVAARLRGKARHVAYAGGWKKFEPLWDLAIRAKRVGRGLPALETILSGFGGLPGGRTSRHGDPGDRGRTVRI
jgi:hypothetical protein